MSKTSSSSRERCKDCAKKREQWRGHPCLRHAPCLEARTYLWDPDTCERCSRLVGKSASGKDEEKDRARGILREILRGIEAAALRKGLVGFVTARTFSERFQPWLGALHSKRVIRKAPAKAPSRALSVSPTRGSNHSSIRPAPSVASMPVLDWREAKDRKSVPSGPSTSATKEAPKTAKQPPPRAPSPQKGKRTVDTGRSSGILGDFRTWETQGEADSHPSDRRSRSRERRAPSESSGSSVMSPISSWRSSGSSVKGALSPHSRGERTPSPPNTPGSYNLNLSMSDSEGSVAGQDEPPKEEDEEMAGRDERPNYYYFWVPHEAKLDNDGLALKGLPVVPRSQLLLRSIEDRQAVAFKDPDRLPQLLYALRLRRAGPSKESSPSQRDRVRTLSNVLFTHEKKNLSWGISDPADPDAPFVLRSSAALEDYASTVTQPKGFGDEARRLPSSPLVPLHSEGEKLQNLLLFLEAPPLSPTSHKLHRGYGDRRTTVEPPKPERDLDTEYRRAGRSALGTNLAWELVKELTSCPEEEAPSRLHAIRAVAEAFHKDSASCMDYLVTRAVHHRRNLIQMSTRDMPQEDIRLTIQELPLPTGASLFHESAAAKVEESLLRPEGRQLQAIRQQNFARGRKYHRVGEGSKEKDRFRKPTGPNASSQAKKPATFRKPSPPHPAPTRKRTHPSHPVAPFKRSKPTPGGAKGKGGASKPGQSKPHGGGPSAAKYTTKH